MDLYYYIKIELLFICLSSVNSYFCDGLQVYGGRI